MSSYWCHQCQGVVRPHLPDVTCPNCHSEFIEEIENDSTNTTTNIPTPTPIPTPSSTQTQAPPPQPSSQPPRAIPHLPFTFGFPNFVNLNNSNFNMQPNPNNTTQPVFNPPTAHATGGFNFQGAPQVVNPFEFFQQNMLNNFRAINNLTTQTTTSTPTPPTPSTPGSPSPFTVTPNPIIQTIPAFNTQPGVFNSPAAPTIPTPLTTPTHNAPQPQTTTFSPQPRVQVSVQTFVNNNNEPHQLPRQNFIFQQQNLAGRTNPFMNLLQHVLQNGNQNGGTFTFGIAPGMNMAPTGTIGDYAFGNMDQILNQLFQQTGRRGPPPASKEEVKKLKKEKIVNKPGETVETCPVCSEEFSPDEEATFMPCEHYFHAECIGHWLEINNNCPICRYELKTDDPEYEARKAQRAQSQTQTAQTQSTTTTTNETNSTQDINNNNSSNNTENENSTHTTASTQSGSTSSTQTSETMDFEPPQNNGGQ
eukprot:TRINITY_DN4628_c0_g1_i2.p1 TRINITY_DN4628_c0_g1~~TRINITY_DN4628_c0_g1_i2.p1  ORF type:complete len:476 (-),score=125.42 TRINITY_DN4628_c0_g1_i2:181-1608(-)